MDGERIAAELKEQAAACALEDRRSTLVQAAADLIHGYGAPYTSVYLYMLHSSEELVLEAFAGRHTEHQCIRVGHGVCGTAVAKDEDQNVGDVQEVSNYIACNRFTKSELVVLIRKNGSIIGQIDVDSDRQGSFSIEEVSAVKLVADALGSLL